ncbi:MAG: hypothetical protein WCT40_03605 [Candidatus Magasanikbacteria bacterium]
MKIALLSVYNKKGIVEFARELVGLGWTIWSSGGTENILRADNIPVVDVATIVGEPILGHRVVTLSRELHAALLSRDTDEDHAELKRIGVERIDLVCCDLYPLQAEIARVGSTVQSVIEQTDIGGPTMIRSAAKGGRIVIADAGDRGRVIQWLKDGEQDSENFKRALTAKAEKIIAEYCLASAEFHSDKKITGLIGTEVLPNKYGENAWQTPAALFSSHTADPLALDKFIVVDGDAPSYNNILDMHRLLQTVTHIAAGWHASSGRVPLIAVGGKHGNACGAAVGDYPEQVIGKMIMGDSIAIFGGFVMVNFAVDEKVARALRHHGMTEKNDKGDVKKRLLDGVIAPSFTPEAIEELGRKGGKCRMIANPALDSLTSDSLDRAPMIRPVRGGFLAQPNYTHILKLDAPEIDIVGAISPEQKNDLILAWAIGCTSNSNTISIVKNGQLLANAVGQQDRVMSAWLAGQRARRSGHDLTGAVAYSDSFFPFTDAPAVLIDAGIRVIFASSGSVGDESVKKLCADRDVTLVMYPDKLGRGFFGH